MNEANRRTWQSIVRPILGLQFGLWLVLAVWALPQPARADFSSTEASTISWFYAAAFGRTPVPNSAASDYGDLGGLAFWTDAYLTGAGGLAPFRGNVYAIADFFVTSDEFQAKYPASLTNEAFIMALYDNMLGRAADEGGLAFWVGQLSAGASRGAVLADFTNTPENQNSNPLRKAALESFIAFIAADADGTITPAEAAVWLAQNPTLDGALVDGASSEYQPGTTAPLTTDLEDVVEFSPGGAPMTLTLSDGTRASVPQLAGDYALLLERLSPDDFLIELMDDLQDITALAPTGSVRSLFAMGEGDPSNFKPVITIPAREAGTVNLETVNVLRVGDVFVNGEIVFDHVTTLPVSVDDDGNLRFIDPFMRDALHPLSAAQSGRRLARSPSIDVPSPLDRISPPLRAGRMQSAQEDGLVYEWIASAEYILTTLQGDFNWNEPPRLVRMIPNDGIWDAEMPGYKTHYRRPATSADLPDLAKQPICNIMLLVHGHNEEEKEGLYSSPSEGSPWWFSYKRRVWDLLYRVIQAESQQQAEYPHECTAFYEFIYPTYRPIFSEVPAKGERRHETLGEALGLSIQELLVKDPQLKAMIDADMPFNVVVVAHSQGGLVARAGFRHMPEEFKRNIVRFVSWGSPHHGAALYTLRYAFQAGHDMILDGVRLPLANIRNNIVTGPILRGGLNANIAIDAPGIRDLRWDAHHKDKLDLRAIFPSITDTNEAQIDPALYSDELAVFNSDYSREIIGMEGFPYTLIHSATSKTAGLDLVDAGGWWSQVLAQQVHRFAKSTAIQQGATLNALLMKGAYEPNDGAVPVYSQTGAGLAHRPQTVHMGDIDHEEFFGAEPEQRTPATIYLGELTAQKTFEVSQLDHQNRSCPVINGQIGVDGNQTVITGRVEFPLYATASGTLGQRIQRVEARVGGQSGAVIGALTFTYEDNGSFRGSGVAANVPGGAIAVVAMLKDGSEVAAEIDYETDITIPNVIGMMQALAEQMLDQVGLVAAVTTTRHATVPAGQVISQNPVAGTRVQSGSTVNIVVSLGAEYTADCGWDVIYSELTLNVSPQLAQWTNARGLLHGPQFRFHGGDNPLRSIFCMYDAYSHGNQQSWYYDGQPEVRSFFVHGKRQDLYTSWYSNGQMKETGNYDNGLKHGVWEFWFENGQKQYSGSYNNGKRVGVWTTCYSSSGVFCDTFDYGGN